MKRVGEELGEAALSSDTLDSKPCGHSPSFGFHATSARWVLDEQALASGVLAGRLVR